MERSNFIFGKAADMFPGITWKIAFGRMKTTMYGFFKINFYNLSE